VAHPVYAYLASGGSGSALDRTGDFRPSDVLYPPYPNPGYAMPAACTQAAWTAAAGTDPGGRRCHAPWPPRRPRMHVVAASSYACNGNIGVLYTPMINLPHAETMRRLPPFCRHIPLHARAPPGGRTGRMYVQKKFMTKFFGGLNSTASFLGLG